jgi:hypothetical protein
MPHSRLLSIAVLAGALAACSDGSGPTGRSQVTFNLAGARPAAGLALLSDTVATPTDTLVLDTVQIVLRDIKFKRVNEDMCDGEHDLRASTVAFSHDGADGGGMDGGENDGNDGHEDACESFNAGPFLLDLPLGPGVTKAFSVAVDTGTFDELRIRIHKPEDDGDANDAQFLSQHPEFQHVSIRVVGTFNGAPFTFLSGLEAEQRMDLVPPLVVADSMTNVDVTIQVDETTWFRNAAGDLVDPASANAGGPNESVVAQNILSSFHAFRDDDRDGEDDHHEGLDD